MISDELAHKFRTTALERIERVEHAWEQVLSTLDDDASRVIQREIHTLKGESQFVGESDVNVVCHKLEDLLDVILQGTKEELEQAGRLLREGGFAALHDLAGEID